MKNATVITGGNDPGQIKTLDEFEKWISKQTDDPADVEVSDDIGDFNHMYAIAESHGYSVLHFDTRI